MRRLATVAVPSRQSLCAEPRDEMSTMARVTRSSTTAAKKEQAAKKSKTASKAKSPEPKPAPKEAEPEATNGIARDLAVKALDQLAHFAKNKASEKKELDKAQLFDDEDDENDILYLQLVKKKYFSDKPQFKPTIIPVTHRVIPEDIKICLIVRDGAVDKIDELESLAVDQIVPVKVVKTDYKNFEKRREFRKLYDLFLVDDAVLNIMPLALGKTFYKTNKYPLPVKCGKGIVIDELKKNIDNALQLTSYLPPMGTLVTVKIGTLKNLEHAADNLMDVVSTLQLDDYRMVLLKSALSPLLPLYYTEKVFGEDDIAEHDVEVKDKKDDEEFERKLLALGTTEDVEKVLGKKLKAKKANDKKKSTASTKDGKVAKNE